MTAIKFCGMTRSEDAAEASRLGAAYVGSIFAPSARRVSPDQAATVWAAAHGARKVGVFGDASVGEILAAANESGLDVIQLHARTRDGTIEGLRSSFRGEIWAVLRVGEAGVLTDAGESALADAILVDSYSESGLGGTGRAFDWGRESEAIRRLRGDKPLIVAGGLDPDNVGAAISALGPDVVDVSSGVEFAPGIKDHARMRAFAQAVTIADAK
ncbi:MAG TPA: phosphoribosylanthranilate isomerase [Gemmatimonadaceae bacterium]|nr:phosphoribosylanthranilate isomerase [Gemmatimonadaceae bacterium]